MGKRGGLWCQKWAPVVDVQNGRGKWHEYYAAFKCGLSEDVAVAVQPRLALGFMAGRA